MKPAPAPDSLQGRFNHAAKVIEERYGEKPLWFKLLMFTPVLIVLTGFVMLLLAGVQFIVRMTMLGLTHQG